MHLTSTRYRAAAQTLDISMNDVSKLPPDLARLPLLQNLTIVGNPIRSIPQSVQQRGATAVIDLLRKRLPEGEGL
jgi:Leucine-rich repeat (LRR) protein